MSTSKQLIKEGEGYRQSTYKCTTGHPTIGYGHKIKPDQKFGSINKIEAEALLDKDLQKAEREVKTHFGQDWNSLGENRQAVLVDMAYNLGSVRWPKLTQAIKDRDYNQAANQIMDSKYANQVGNRAKRNAAIMRDDQIYTKQQGAKMWSNPNSSPVRISSTSSSSYSTSQRGLNSNGRDIGYTSERGVRTSVGFCEDGPQFSVSIGIPCSIM